MALESGRKLGPYEIVEPLGAGGMGEVYRARDSRLERQVAIKVLPAALTGNEQVRARFEREAKTISRLNHPNICTLHDVGNVDGIEFLVMEYIEGKSLAEILEKGPLPLDEALRYGIQVAEALGRAHRQGVVHRDLKPGNVMITPAGAKLLDFGLAKTAREASEPVDGLTNLPTQQHNLTEEGTILGTVQYMAPEQLEGKEADARTDIFAFGMLLFEMITGRKAFTGKSRVSLIAAIMEHQPPSIASMQPLSPPALDRLIRTCLEKDADDRWQTAHDLELQLRWIEEGGSEVGLPAPIAARRKGRERVSWIVAALFFLGMAAFAGFWYRATHAPVRMVRTTILPAPKTRLGYDDGLAISPVGSTVAFVANDETGTRRIYLRRLADPEPQPLTGTEGGWLPFWSWDGRQIGFMVRGTIKKTLATGGPAQTICEAPEPRGAAWGPNDVIVFNGAEGGLWRVSSAGGTPTKLASRDASKGEKSLRWPSFLPDGDHVVFVAQTAEGGSPNDQSTIDVVSLSTGKRTTLFGANSSIQYAAGHLLFWREGSLLAQPFDADTLALTGDPFPIVEHVAYSGLELAAFNASREGTLVVQHGDFSAYRTQLAWYDRKGTRLETVGDDHGLILNPRLSWDGTRVAYEMDDDIWVRDLARGTVSRLTFEPGEQGHPVWSPDDQWIAYASLTSPGGIFRKRSSGIGQSELLVKGTASAEFLPEVWSADGKSIVYRFGVSGKSDIGRWLVDEGRQEVLLETPFPKYRPKLSPDGRWVALLSNDTGQIEVYVYQLSGAGGKWQISNNGGGVPVWSRDGKSIYYLESGKLMVVAVETGDSFHAGLPRFLMDVPAIGGPYGPYDVNADGSRFLWNTLVGGENTEAEPITIIQHWTELLEKGR
jgi:Tol biopolymer transport system component/predicted Ser/Thr protein kinase